MRKLALLLLVLVLASVANAQSVPCEALPATLSDGTPLTCTLHLMLTGTPTACARRSRPDLASRSLTADCQ